MTHWIKTVTLASVPVLMLSGCVDDNYDLSDIDTTTRITVNDLVIPVNIDDVKLSDILDIDADSKIKVVTIGGKEFYALSETGTFGSDAIFVEKITADAPVMSPTTKTLSQVIAEEGRGSRAASSADGMNTYVIEEMGNDFDYDAGVVDEAIKEVYSIKVSPMEFHVHLTARDVEDSAEKIYFTDLVITMPKGMVATASIGDYDPATGLWTIASHQVPGNMTDATLTATAIDLRANDCRLAPDGSLTFAGSFRVRSGLLTIEAKRVGGVPVPLPETLEFSADYTLNDLTVNSFSGVIDYRLSGMDIAPVEITDIPDFFSDPQTDLLLDNPQLYLQMNNPVAGNSLYYQADIELEAIRDGLPTAKFEPEAPFKVGYGRGVTGPYNIVMAPQKDALTTPDDFKAGLDFVRFPSLGNLFGSTPQYDVTGIPSSIGISVVSPRIPRQEVTDFMLGVDIPGVSGRYELLAPMALRDGSVIVYSDTETGWGSEDLDALTITRLEASVNVTNSLPLDAKLVAYPLDADGNRIPGVEVKAQEIKAGCTDTPVTIAMTGEITRLDGVVFQAMVYGADPDKTLTPSQTITLKNIRACVSGYYEKEL